MDCFLLVVFFMNWTASGVFHIWEHCASISVFPLNHFFAGFQIPPPSCTARLVTSTLSASSEWDAGHRAANGLLHHQAGSGRTGAWSSRYNNQQQWLLFRFAKMAKVSRVATQGRMDANQWVKSYKLAYSLDGIFFQFYREHGQVRVSLARPTAVIPPSGFLPQLSSFSLSDLLMTEGVINTFWPCDDVNRGIQESTQRQNIVNLLSWLLAWFLRNWNGSF